jgi:eukaryotic-like serine/threonine-protein kinase
VDNVPVTTPAQRYLAGRYRLEEVLGRGATGTVWAAYDEMLHRRVAVKEVPPPPGMPQAEADALRERTLREARAIAVLSHPNVVTLFDVVRQDGEPFVVMELLPSCSLATLIGDRGPLDVPGAALVGYAVASALQAAHGAGITHRDVKPGNVLLGTGADDGRIKLTDFGIARNVAESAMTQTGMTLGSPAFIAPEVASGGQVTPAADLWGLGATLFAAVHGRPPYDAGDALATVAAVVDGEVPKPTIDGPLVPVITGLMVKDPAHRMPLTEVCRALRPLLPADGKLLRDPPSGAAAASAASEVTTRLAAWKAPADAAARIDPHTPLSADPGPLPFALPSAPPHGTWSGGEAVPLRQRSWLAAVALALAGVLFFGGGLIGGFGLSRLAAGAPLIPQRSASRVPTAPATPATEVTGGDRSGLRVQQVSVTNDRPGTTEPVVTTFTIGVPEGWAAYRPPLSDADTPIIAMFVSPEGNRTIAVDRLPGFYPKGNVKTYLATLRATLADSVADVVAQPVNAVGTPTAGAPEGPFETSFRTVERGARGASGELLRTTQLYLRPAGTDLWVIKVTVPSDQQKAADTLYTQVVASFVPS